MKNKFAVLAFIAVAFSAVSCGNDAPDESSVTLDLPVVTTETAETETSTEVITTAKTTAKTTVVSEISTAETTEVTTEVVTEAVTEEVTEAPAEQATEPPVVVDEPEITEPPEPEPPATEPPVQVQFSMDNLSGSAADIINTLGEPLDVQDAAGCLSNGDDQRIYTYDGLQISCYINGDTPYIYQIMITNSSYSTTAGITVGSSRTDVENAYGTGEEMGGYVVYAGEGKELDVQYNGDTVSSIIFYMAV